MARLELPELGGQRQVAKNIGNPPRKVPAPEVPLDVPAALQPVDEFTECAGSGSTPRMYSNFSS
jgi:hypothetical protein